ncbi:hypothetical protein [Marinobacter arenosus]|uniref:hypothetical protein n=1 Tax=Marinobacter arenosus TaxID=2856822 RepID=UPI001C4C3C4A|nr:hypothetical protein [Marinobacter arenosus]MBW0148968.1 hypothetical protein [Marinobacter arenosus]
MTIGLLFAFILVGCGGSGSEGNNPAESTGSDAETVDNQTVQSNTGYFVDAPVKGLRYRTDTLEGTTDALGRFNYQPGETISFRIGGTELGASDAVGFMTPGSLDETGQWDGTRAINIARLLLTLDSDQNPLNGIVIDDQAHLAFADLGFDLSVSPQQLTESSVLQEALKNADRIGLVTVDYARDHLSSVAEQLPDAPSEADIIALLDTGPNYSGRQTPMTATPDNLRQAAQVFWADPAKPAPDIHWLLSLFDPQILRDVFVRFDGDQAQPPGIRVLGNVEYDENDKTLFKSASLVVSFDDFNYGGRAYNGSVVTEILPGEAYELIYLPEDATETTTVNIETFEYGLYFYDLRVTGADGSLGIHGWQSVVQTVENPYRIHREWTMDVTLRELYTDRLVRLFAENLMSYDEDLEGMGANYGRTAILEGPVTVAHSSLGSFDVDGTIRKDAPDGIVEEAHLEFYRDDTTMFGTVTAILPPESEDPNGHVLSEVLSPETGESVAFERFELKTPLTRSDETENSTP